MCNLMKATAKDCDRYQSSLNWIYYSVNWQTRPSLNALLQELSPLTGFYLNPQTKETRNGVLSLLSHIRNEIDYRKLVMLQGELISFLIEFDKAIEPDYIGKNPYTFFYFLSQNPQKTADVLKRASEIYAKFASHTHHILEYLFRLGGFVVSPPSADIPPENFINFFLRRSNNFLSGIETIQRQLAAARLVYDAGSLIPTGGDMHCDGKVPCIIDYDNGKYVYKPRDMRIDWIVTQAIAFCSQFLEKEMQLPSLNIRLLPDTTGLVQFAFHTDEMSGEQVGRYFTKLGALLCISKLFGVRDLHYENIMATLEGPVVIDMECAFSASAISSEDICDPSLCLMKQAFSCKAAQNATFSVEGQVPVLAAFREQIINGFTTAAACLYNHRQQLIEYYRNLLTTSVSYRIVPVATQEFYETIYSFLNDCPTAAKIKDSLKPLYKQLYDRLYQYIMECMPRGQFEQCLKNKFFQDEIYRSLFYGNIPILNMEVKAKSDGIVYYTGYINGVSFFKRAIAVTSLDNLSAAFETQIKYLKSKSALEAVKQFIDR